MKKTLLYLSLVMLSLSNSAAYLHAEEVVATPVSTTKMVSDAHTVIIELVEVDRVALRKAGVDWSLAPDEHLTVQPIKEGTGNSFLAYLKLLKRDSLAEHISTPAVEVKPNQAASFKHGDDNREIEISVQSDVDGDQVHGVLRYKCLYSVGSKTKGKTQETGFTSELGQRLIATTSPSGKEDSDGKSRYVLITISRKTEKSGTEPPAP